MPEPKRLKFSNSKELTLGLEIELLLIDSLTHEAVSLAPSILEILHKEGLEHFTCELKQSSLELATPVFNNVQECREYFLSNFEILQNLAQKMNFSFVSSSTHPFTPWQNTETFPDIRYLSIVEKWQGVAKRLHVNGFHVHVGMPDGDTAIYVIEEALRYLPHLLALSANSPFWNGVDTGLQSYRFSVMESLPFTYLPPYFENFSKFEEYFFTLKDRGLIQKMKDLHWHIRPRMEFGTVEFRICDAPLSIDDMLAIAVLIQSLCVYLVENKQFKDRTIFHENAVRALSAHNLFEAWRYGIEGRFYSEKSLESTRLKDELYNLVDMLLPIAKRLSSESDLLFIKEIISKGTGADLQRKAFNARGNLKDVTAMLISSLISGRQSGIPS